MLSSTFRPYSIHSAAKLVYLSHSNPRQSTLFYPQHVRLAILPSTLVMPSKTFRSYSLPSAAKLVYLSHSNPRQSTLFYPPTCAPRYPPIDPCNALEHISSLFPSLSSQACIPFIKQSAPNPLFYLRLVRLAIRPIDPCNALEHIPSIFPSLSTKLVYLSHSNPRQTPSFIPNMCASPSTPSTLVMFSNTFRLYSLPSAAKLAFLSYSKPRQTPSFTSDLCARHRPL